MIASIAASIRQLIGRIGEVLRFLEPLPPDAASDAADTRTVRLVRQNGGDFDGPLYEVCLADAIKVLTRCEEEIQTQLEADNRFDGSRGFRLIRDEGDYLRVYVVGADEAHVISDFLATHTRLEARLLAQRIHFSAEMHQVETVLEQYFSLSRESFEDTYCDYVVDHIVENPWMLT